MTERKRYRFVLIEEPESTLPVRYLRRPSPPPGAGTARYAPRDPMGALVEAFALLQRRSGGPEAWAPVLSDNPMAFLLDALEDAIFLRDEESGRLLYSNRAANRIPEHCRCDEDEATGVPTLRCRRMTFRWRNSRLVLEVIHQAD